MDQSVEGSASVLKIDIDPGQELYTREHMRRLLERAGYKLVRLRKVRSPSGKGWHVYVELDRPVFNWHEMVALQAILGSDRYREACNVQRVRTLANMEDPEMRAYWTPRFNVFYARR